MSIFNQYSFLWLALAVTVIAALVFLRRKPRLPDFLAVGVVLLALLTAWLLLRPRQTILSDEAAEVQARIGQGTPVLLEFQSPYCLACTAIKPPVDRLEAQYAGRLIVLRVNVQSQAGRELAAVYGFQYTPTFIFFDAAGQERWREVGGLTPERLEQSLSP
ncbi:MAG: thioredoxin family protein [Anaerolineales bacterium]